MFTFVPAISYQYSTDECNASCDRFRCTVCNAYRFYSVSLQQSCCQEWPCSDTRLQVVWRPELLSHEQVGIIRASFCSIAGAGPLLVRFLQLNSASCQVFCGWWLGAVMAGAVHDFVFWTASVKHDGNHLLQSAKAEINRISGCNNIICIILIIVVALAGLGLVVVMRLPRAHGEHLPLPQQFP